MHNADATKARSKSALKAFRVQGFRRVAVTSHLLRKTAVDASLDALNRLKADSHAPVYEAGHPYHSRPRSRSYAHTYNTTLFTPPYIIQYAAVPPTDSTDSPPPAPPLSTRHSPSPPHPPPPFTLSDFCSVAGSTLRSCWTEAIGNLLLRMVG